jgi:hypothetical protein
LYPFFDLHNAPIKAAKTDLPFVVSLFVEYTYYRKIGAWLNGQFGKRRNKEEERKNERKDLTLTGLLMEDLGC